MAITTPLNSNGTAESDTAANGEMPSSPAAATTTREAEEEAAKPLLARANLFRMRGQWDEAVAVCTEALRRAPHSPTAHSLLGDVYEAQNKTDEAVQWYGMACDLDPTNQSDRAKLDKAAAAQNAKVLAAQKAAGVVAPAPAHKPAAEKTLEWIDRIFPPGKSESVARLIFALSGVIAVMILVAAGILWQAGRNNNALPTVQTMPGHSGDLPPVTSVQPVVVNPPVAARPVSPVTTSVQPTNRTSVPATSGTVAGTATNTPAVNTASGTAANSALFTSISARFTNLLAANAQVAPTLRLQNAQMDSAQNAVRLEVVAQAVAGETPAQTRERIVRAAALAVRAASEANLTATNATVKVALQTAPNAAAGASAAQAAMDAFSGALPLSSARDMEVWSSAPGDLLSRFSSLQWSPAFNAAQTQSGAQNASQTNPVSAPTQTGGALPPR